MITANTFKIMEDKIQQQLRAEKVREMKNPTILMNPDDYTAFKTELESTVQNLCVGKNPTYEGIPIKTNEIVQKGNVIVYDDVLPYVEGCSKSKRIAQTVQLIEEGKISLYSTSGNIQDLFIGYDFGSGKDENKIDFVYSQKI